MTPPPFSDFNLPGGVTIKGKILILVTVAVTLSLASVAVLSNIGSNADDETRQMYDYDGEVHMTEHKIPWANPPAVTKFVYLYDGGHYNVMHTNGTYTNNTITNKTEWDTDKTLYLDSNVRLIKCSGDGLSPNIGTEGKFNYSVTVKLIAGANTDSFTIPVGTVYNSPEERELRAGGLQANIMLGKPETYATINNSTSLDFLKVIDPEQFKSVLSPVRCEFTIGTGDGAVTSTINIKFNDSGHTPPENPSQSALRYNVIGNQNGYSVLDVSVDSKYAGTENYLLAIAKYEGSIVYNSYVKVPTSENDKVRLAFSSDRLKQVILEIVPNNDAFGDSVPGYLAYCIYEANQT